jgi:hypothetical protein
MADLPLRPTIDDTFAPARASHTYTVELDGEAVVLDEVEQRLHLLNHSASLLWAVFDGHATLAELAAEIATELSLPADTVLDDARRAVLELADEGLLDGIAAAEPIEDPTP